MRNAKFALLGVSLLAASLWLGGKYILRSPDSGNEGASLVDRTMPSKQVPESTDVAQSASLTDTDVVTPLETETGPGASTLDDTFVWPYELDVMESMIFDRLSLLPNSSISSIPSVDCEQTVCQARLIMTSNDVATQRDFQQQLGVFLGPPFTSVRARGRTTSQGVFEVTVTLHSHSEASDDDTGAAVFPFSAAQILEVAVLDPRAYDSPPVKAGMWNGAEIVVENICFNDCPRDTEQVIRFELPENRTCEQFGGIQREVLATWSPSGFRDRVLCVPANLQ